VYDLKLAQQEFAPTATETDRTETYPWDNVAKLRDAGFMGMTIPTSLGGRG
jgi:alkylation response protein AidB-like acyl-CoA dehydrogenase